MLNLTRKPKESIMIGDDIRIEVRAIHGRKVSLGIDAPAELAIHRQEVYDAIHTPSEADTLDRSADLG